MDTVILGGGLAGLSLAHFLKQKSVVLEKERQIGGLCRSFNFKGVMHDIGPHILFSKNKKALGDITSLLDADTIRRSNKIFYNSRLVKYPFENDLASLDKEDREYCLKEFLSNPYENYEASDMLKFFLKTFGEGITKLYLQPYNEKIWKFDLAFMDTQMVDRIPKPPKEDVIKSAKGIPTEGYTHQLYFQYPKKGGIESLVKALEENARKKARIVNPVKIGRVSMEGGAWKVKTDKGVFSANKLVNCMPLHELAKCIEMPDDVMKALGEMRYNSIYIVAVHAKKDAIGDNFALYFADKDVIFHRLSKLSFLGKNYQPKEGAIILAEITFRPDSYLAGLSAREIMGRVASDLEKIGLVRRKDVLDIEVKEFKYAYVIYDLHHRRNADYVLNHLSSEGIDCCGRFAEFEYLNMDGVMMHSCKLAEKLNGEGDGG